LPNETKSAHELSAAAEQLETLDEAFQRAVSQSPRVEPRDVIVQDEYTHDVLFRVADGSYLVFDTT